MLVLWYTIWALLASTQAFPIPFWILPSKSIAARSIDAPPEEADKIDFKDGIFDGVKKFVKRQWGAGYSYPQSIGYYPPSSYYPSAPAPVNPWSLPWPGSTPIEPDTHQGDRGFSPCDSPQALSRPVSCSGGSFQLETTPKGPYAGLLGGGTERKGSFNAYAFGAQITPAFQPFADFSKVVKGKNIKFSISHDDNNSNDNSDDGDDNSDDDPFDNNSDDGDNSHDDNSHDDNSHDDNSHDDNSHDDNSHDSFNNFGNSRRASSILASAGASTGHLGVGAGKSIKHVGASLSQVGKAVGSLGDGVGGASKSLGNGIGKLPNGHLRRRKATIARS